MKTGRNDPCPCGSGKKYKHCCLLIDNPASVDSDDLLEILSNADANLLEEAEELANEFMHHKNHQGHVDFLGLSPAQMERVLYHPFEPSHLFTMPKTLALEPQAPILYLVQGIAAAIDDKGLKTTALGKLPAKLCKSLFEEYKFCKPGKFFSKYVKVNREDDFYDLHIARVAMDLSGLLRKTKGRFYLTKKYHKVMSTTGKAGLYPILFEGFCKKFHWAYGDSYEEMLFIQHSFLFSLYMLHKFGSAEQNFAFYENKFMQAFPMVVNGLETTSDFFTPEEEVQNCYANRVLDRFFWFMGLASIELVESDAQSSGHRMNEKVIKKLPLLDAVVWFHFSAKEQSIKSIH